MYSHIEILGWLTLTPTIGDQHGITYHETPTDPAVRPNALLLHSHTDYKVYLLFDDEVWCKTSSWSSTRRSMATTYSGIAICYFIGGYNRWNPVGDPMAGWIMTDLGKIL